MKKLLAISSLTILFLGMIWGGGWGWRHNRCNRGCGWNRCNVNRCFDNNWGGGCGGGCGGGGWWL
jgi:hypothetical protein